MQTGLRTRRQCSGSRGLRHQPRPFVSASRGPPKRWQQVASNEPDKEPSIGELKDKFFKSSEQQRRSEPSSSGQQEGNILDSVNPYQLGRQARQAVNTLWGQLSAVAAPTKSFTFDDVLDMGLDTDAPSSASKTRVLVIGATGRVGRILSRKLLLRGYKVRALVRKREGMRSDAEGVPDAVEVISGDVGEMRDCQRAVRGVDKVRMFEMQPSLPTGPQPWCCNGALEPLGCYAARAAGWLSIISTSWVGLAILQRSGSQSTAYIHTAGNFL